MERKRSRIGAWLEAARAGDPFATYLTQHAPLPLLVPVSLYFAHVHGQLLACALAWAGGAACFQVPWIRYMRQGQHPPTGAAQTIAAATSTTALIFSPQIWLLVVAFCSMGVALALLSNRLYSAVFQLGFTGVAVFVAWREGLVAESASWVLLALLVPMAIAAAGFVSSDLAWEKRRLSSSLAISGTTAWEVDSTGRVVQVLGSPLAGIEAGCRLSEVIHPDDERPSEPEPGSTLEYRVGTERGEWRWIREHIEAESMGSRTRRSGVLDISDAREQSDDMRRRATIDELTSMPNRASHLAMSAQWADRGSGFLLLVDLDDFKDVNDTLGHNAGDRVLAVTADRLGDVEGPAQTARLGGDEFAALVDGDTDEVVAIAQRLAAAVSEPVRVDAMVISTGASVGVAQFGPGVDSDEVRRCAGVALREAKNTGVDVVLYNETLESTSARRKKLAAHLPVALAAGQFTAVHQFKVDLESGKPIGTEALVRWNHPEYGLVQPGEFLDLIAVGGHHRALLDVVLPTALRDIACLIERTGDADLSVAVNVHAHNIREVDFVERVAQALEDAELLPHNLILELNEEALVTEDGRVPATLFELSQRGVRLSVDDFGTGYSALGYLARLPIAEIKIDRSLVAKIAESSRDRAVVDAVLGLADRLGYTVVGEGIEDRRTLDCLADLGCPIGQGYFIGRPVPLDELDEATERPTDASRLAIH